MKTKGQSLVEYGLILALAAVVCITSLRLLGNSISDQLTGLSSAIDRAALVATASSGGTATPTSGGSNSPALEAAEAGQADSNNAAEDNTSVVGNGVSKTGSTPVTADNNTSVNPQTGEATMLPSPAPDSSLEQKPTDAAVPVTSQGAALHCQTGNLCVTTDNALDSGSSWGF